MTEDPESKRKRAIEKMKSARYNYIGAQGDINKAREHLDDIGRNVSRAIYDIERALPVYQNIPGGAGIGHNSTYASLVNSGCNIAEKMYEHSIGIKHLTGRLPGNMIGAVFSTSASTSASGNMCGIAYDTGVAALKVFQDNRPLREAVEQAKRPNPIEERNAFAEKLKKIELRLCTKFEGMWQTLSDPTKKDRYRQAATSMREVMSDFQQILSPDEEVKKAKWFKPERTNGMPTQRQRVKYAIIGAGQQELVSDEDVKLIDALMNDARDRYEDLNKILHARKDEVEEDFPLLESYIESCQTNMIKILELREKFFKDNPT
jgi:hypothetical protein